MKAPPGLVRLARPVVLALVTGRADPPFPRASFLRVRLPRMLGLLPFRTLDLVLVADLLVFWLLQSQNLDQLRRGNATLAFPFDEMWIYLGALAASAPVVLREYWPLASWRIAMASLLVTVPIHHIGDDLFVTFNEAVTHLLVVYSVAVRCDRRATAGVLGVSALVLFVSPGSVNDTLLAVILLGITALLGHNVRGRRLTTRRLAEEEQRSERALAAQATLEERARIARELHDVVAHHMSVIAIQAEAVPLRASGDAERLEEGLREIRALSLSAMTEMRRVIGVLRDAEGRADTAPQPGLGRLDELVGNARSAGLTVTLSLSGALTGLPEAVSLSAYRITQEALSNAMRHAPGSAVSVRISHSGGALSVNVTNDAGRPGSPERTAGPGHGLVGMRERVTMLGGKLWAGPAGTGFAITAILPVVEET
ncbi:sensor histidine kinase [Streptosporangium saharense]|uniref:histidine kinase n=1 Tax=Streptosporangium saharense TaxID=1706840 RepID=A0A7W7QL29_9ACTN|nr:sensor histidine kinase [Streptosporangium saharense]MBB4915562.1 signal transduction histidine kinase [Streptosporangium saharense]